MDKNLELESGQKSKIKDTNFHKYPVEFLTICSIIKQCLYECLLYIQTLVNSL